MVLGEEGRGAGVLNKGVGADELTWPALVLPALKCNVSYMYSMAFDPTCGNCRGNTTPTTPILHQYYTN